MDQLTEATELPALRVVAGTAVRVFPRTGDDELVGIRVQVVGDDVLARRGVLAAVAGEPGMVVVGDSRPGPGAFATLASRHPDVVLLHGVDAYDAEPILAAIRRTGRIIRVLSIGVRAGETAPDVDGFVCGSLPAWTSPEEVVAAVRVAAAGFALQPADRLREVLPIPRHERPDLP
jgi:DNA-binding NarL/FixJ family response regulator